MSETTCGSESLALSGFDETLPCFEDTSLPGEVYELQSVYARINHEETSDTDTSIKDEKTEHDMHESLQNPKRFDVSRETESTNIYAINDSHEVSHKQDIFEVSNQEASPVTTSLHGTKSSRVNAPRVETEWQSAGSSVQSTALISELQIYDRNDINKGSKLLKLSESTSGSGLNARPLENMNDLGDKKSKHKHGRRSKTGLSKSENYDVTEKTNMFHASLSGSTSAEASVKDSNETQLKHTESDFGKSREMAATQWKTSTGKHINTGLYRENRNKSDIRQASVFSELGKYRDSKETEKWQDQSSKTLSLARCKTAPVKLPSHNSPKKQLTDKEMEIADDALGSDAYVSVCSKCKKNEKDTPATSYCLKCAYYMCCRCLRHHDRMKSKVVHQILKGSNMPGSFTLKKFEIKRNLSEKCSRHTHRNVKFFCLDHNVLCCTVCKSSDHAVCRMQHLDDLLIQTPDIRKLKHKTSEVITLKLNSLRKLRQALRGNVQFSDKEKDFLIEEVKQSSSMMVEHIRKLEEQFTDHIRETYKAEQRELKSDIEECEKFINLISNDIQYLEEPRDKTESKLRTIEKVKQIETVKMPQNLERHLAEGDTRCRISHEFRVNSELLSCINEKASLGELVPKVSNQPSLPRTAGTENCSRVAEQDFGENQGSKYVAEFQTFSGWDEGDIASSTCFTAVELLDDGSILVSDQKNLKLKWFDSDISLLHSANVSSEPWGIGKLCENKFIVMLPMELSCQVVDIAGGNLKLCRKIELGIECTSVIRTEMQLMFAGIDVDKPILILTDFNGKNKELALPEEKLKLLRRPNHLLKSFSDTKLILVSDVDRGIFGLDIEKKEIIFHYSHRNLKCTIGMTTTKKGHILICSQHTNRLFGISKDGQYLFSVSTDYIQDMRKPQCICYLPHLDEFIMTSDENYNIIRFKLS